jgi:SAM-dependent methyltransferase
MTRHVIGTAEAIAGRREECERAIGQLCLVDANDPVAKVITRLRRQLGDDLTDLVVSVAALQKKAQQKLSPASANSHVWWVTKKSLQQATAWQVARLKSTWLDNRLVYDLCCGIGGDAIQLARRGRSRTGAQAELDLLVAVDSDSLMVEFAAANLAHAGATTDHADARCGDAAKIEIPKEAAVHMDPDRRAGGDRRSRPDFYQPSWSQVSEIVKNLDSAIVKLAPAAQLGAGQLDTGGFGETHRCWISLAGSVREQSLLCGKSIELAGVEPGLKSAVALSSDGSAAWFAPRPDELDSASKEIASRPLSMLIDPDASVRAAGLTEAFARHHGLRLLGKASGFLTCDDGAVLTTAAKQMAVTGTVIWSGSCDDRKLRRELRSRDTYPRVIKVRGTDHDPAALAKRYRKCGDQPVTLWIGRTSDRVFAAITVE